MGLNHVQFSHAVSELYLIEQGSHVKQDNATVKCDMVHTEE